MGYQSKTYSLSDDVVEAIQKARKAGISPNRYLRHVIGIKRLSAEEANGLYGDIGRRIPISSTPNAGALSDEALSRFIQEGEADVDSTLRFEREHNEPQNIQRGPDRSDARRPLRAKGDQKR